MLSFSIVSRPQFVPHRQHCPHRKSKIRVPQATCGPPGNIVQPSPLSYSIYRIQPGSLFNNLFSFQRFSFILNTELHENPYSGSRVLPSGQIRRGQYSQVLPAFVHNVISQMFRPVLGYHQENRSWKITASVTFVSCVFKMQQFTN